MVATQSFLEPPKMLAGENIVKMKTYIVKHQKSLIPSNGGGCHLQATVGETRSWQKILFLGTNPRQTKEREACKDLHETPRKKHSHALGRIEDQDGRQGWSKKICQA